MKKLIRDCKFVVFPSQSYETFGISILEAYSYGKPVLASKIGALPEILKDGMTGYLFEASNAGDFTNKLLKLWRDSNVSQKMSIKGRELVKREYDPDKHYSRLMDIYTQIQN